MPENTMSWSQMKAAVEAQMARDPQRATLATRAWQAVEDGLQQLAGAGYNFEIAPRGTLNELTELKPKDSPTDLSIGTTQKMLAQPRDPVNRQFEAIAGGTHAGATTHA